MATRIDHNGKMFTDHVRKRRVAAVIQTTTHRVRGFVFQSPDERLKDQLNESGEQFMALADAEVLSADGAVIERAAFLTLNKSHVVWVLPAESPDGAPSQGSHANGEGQSW